MLVGGSAFYVFLVISLGKTFLCMHAHYFYVRVKRLADFDSTLFPCEETITFFFSFCDTKWVPCNAGNAAGFSNTVQEHLKVGCPS